MYPIFGGLGDEFKKAERRMVGILRSADVAINTPQILFAGLVYGAKLRSWRIPMRQRQPHLPRRQVRVGMPGLRFAPRTGLGHPPIGRVDPGQVVRKRGRHTAGR